MGEYFILGMVYAFAAAVQPGPLQAYLISQALTQGWRRAIFASFAPVISDGPIIITILFVLHNISGWMIQVLQCAGGIFLLYLAYKAWKTWQNYNLNKTALIQSTQETVLKAALVNFLNPNPYLGWSLVMGPLLLKGWRASPLNGIALLVGFYSTIVLVSAAIVVLFASARNLGPRMNRKLIGISVVALICLGLYQLWSGIFTLWWK